MNKENELSNQIKVTNPSKKTLAAVRKLKSNKQEKLNRLKMNKDQEQFYKVLDKHNIKYGKGQNNRPYVEVDLPIHPEVREALGITDKEYEEMNNPKEFIKKESNGIRIEMEEEVVG